MDLEQIQYVSGLSYQMIGFLAFYKQAAIFFGTFFLAESIVLASSFLAAQGFWSIKTVFVFSLLGTVSCDFFWYFWGLRFLKITHQWNTCLNIYDKIAFFADKVTRRSAFLMFLLMKFLYGTRFLMVIYLGAQKMRFLKFVVYDLIVTCIWLLVVIPIGWLAGRGMYSFFLIYKNLNYVFIALIILIIIFKLAQRLIYGKIIKIG